ncbi:MAG: hypothetical protein H7Y60_11980 [Rhodospirillaceae bacterium]|nr:hypothetical protein [Rhodospirillales bacterium]
MSEISVTGIQVREELDKAASLVVTARRLLATGTMVDLSALEGKVRVICEKLVAMGREDGKALVPAMEVLIGDLDRLADAIHERVDPPSMPSSGSHAPSGGV